ncbi:M28 family metallopeptidase [Sporanaerobacter sp. PP17-6a]|jgi:aminopeptidase YwaD|uniref:M28 family metallopeptidase n=1 Tax=Sporanaerobacter sp. PP17-6a TaxID=1891289 RepID=UPI00089FBDCD|nr:M28 family peptidase [Sporanaerobacter sp. PP17-6a]SCL96083.1 hypothetical protein PP176A_3025 [Sporanaerobacter sp. PP17-6a]
MKNKLYYELINGVSKKNMEDLIRYFSHLNRLTGTDDCEEAASYICNQLEHYGVSYERYEFVGYFSNPIKSVLTVFTENNKTEILSKPRSFSLNCPEGITGDLIYDSKSLDPQLCLNEERDWYLNFRGKVVLSWNFSEDYVKKIEFYGAKGIIHIWKTEEEVIHEETVGPVWGTPTLESFKWIPKIPVIGIRKADGLSLIDSVSRDDVKVLIQSLVEYKTGLVSLPVAYIPGKLDEYVLVSGHYDSWYEGITDNAVGNAVCMEIARLFNNISKNLERGIKVAFWPGHSNGRYAGSSWFCDNFWFDLHDNCIAHLNIDSPGSQGAEVVLPRTTILEGESFTKELIKEFTGNCPENLLEIPRGADQSFWGADIPYHIMYKYEPIRDKKIYNCPGSGGGWWWHSEFDNLDKLDMDMLIRDSQLNIATVYKFVTSKLLPADFEAFFSKQEDTIKILAKNSDDSFNFNPILDSLSSLRDKLLSILKKDASVEKINKLIKIAGGGLNRLIYSSGSRYEFDDTFPSKPFIGLQHVFNIYKENTPEEEFIFALTGFIRQRNRIVNELKEIEMKIDALSQ